MVRTALYTRVSSSLQDGEDKVSLSEQIADCETYARERGLDVVARYSEVGRGTTKHRPQFQAMLADARAGRFDTILAWKSDRLGRGMYPAAALMEVVEASGVTLEAVRDSVDTDNFALMAAVAGMELSSLRERVSMGKRGAAKAGRIPVKALPYGYARGPHGEPQVDEYKSAVVRRIYQLSLDGLGVRRIASTLTGEGIPAPSGGARWWSGSVQAILADETYTGVWYFGRKRTRVVEGGRRVERMDKASQIAVPVPVLIDRQAWEQVQALKLERRKGSGGKRKHFYLLSQQVTCSECGRGFSGQAMTSRKPEDAPRRFYRCAGSLLHGLKCRPHPYVDADRLEQLVWDEVKDVVTDPDSFHAALGDADGSDVLDADVALAERALVKVSAEEDRAVWLYINGDIDDAMLTRQRRFITERLEAAQAVLDGLRGQQRAEWDRQAVADSITAWAGKLAERIGDLDAEGRRDVLRLVLEAVTIDGDDRVRLTFAAPAEFDDARMATSSREYTGTLMRR